MKKALAIVLVMVLLCSTGAMAATTNSEKEKLYSNAVFELETYLMLQEVNEEHLQEIYDTFASLKTYSYSKSYCSYTELLMLVTREQYGYDFMYAVNKLETDKSFGAYLTKNRSALDSPIGTVQELLDYAYARQAEFDGNAEEASVMYEMCLDFYDSQTRYDALAGGSASDHYYKGKDLMSAGDLEGAYAEFALANGWEDSNERMAFIVKQLGYEPSASKHEHMWDKGTVKRAATCTSTGVRTRTCVLCGATSDETIAIDRNNHTGGTVLKNKKDATCGTQGYSGDTCCRSCGTVVRKGYTIEPTGAHRWNNGKVTKEATCVSKGVRTFTCSVCGTTKKQDIPATSIHDWMPATATRPMTCRICGKTQGSPVSTGGVSVGDIIEMGYYEQDGSSWDGPEPIEWIVLAREGNTAFVGSKYALEGMPFNQEHEHVVWAQCSLRDWLNNDFFYEAFGYSEQDRIINKTIVTDGSKTQDRVFLLSKEEAKEYFSNDDARMCAPTEQAVINGVKQRSSKSFVDGLGTWWYWLRSSGRKTSLAARVYVDGGVKSEGCNVESTDGAVRPCMWITVD